MIRRRVAVVVSPSEVEEGIFWVEVRVRKEREVLPLRKKEQNDPETKSSATGDVGRPWIPDGRDRAAEAVIIRRLEEWKTKRN
jgi:hypothetical protein